jgi:phage terminase large subunit GpA-like protein
VLKVRAGQKVMAWEQRYSRNEPLDCRNYATAALELLLLSTPALLHQLAARVGAPQAAPTNRPPTGRRVLSRGVE